MNIAFKTCTLIFIFSSYQCIIRHESLSLLLGRKNIRVHVSSNPGHAAIEDIMQILPELDALFVEEGVTFAREDLVNTVP